jgi:nitrate reductase alpha subunit
MMWGSNVPVTRTPDAHWMAEVRYRGTKVVTVSPDYADNTKFADEWMPCAAGTDGALAMAMGHVILSECFVEQRVPFFVDYVRRYTDLPFLVKLEERDGALVPARTSPQPIWACVENAAFKPVLLDGATDRRRAARVAGIPLRRRRHRQVEPRPRRRGAGADGRAATRRTRRDRADPAAALRHRRRAWRDLARGAGARVGEHLVCTVFDLMLAQYGWPAGLPGDWPTGYDDPQPYTPAWQEPITGVRRRRRSGSPASSPATPRSPAAGR